ncbi:MAG: type I glyceraldehyde-3-phosphate dehydrogenase [Desulfobacterales bacterium]|nr:type I glyceraldehyde-3-phosphate dehydrogenase [Desulfobacterales bacterium]
MANVAITGVGRIGRATLKIILDTPGLNLVAINDLISPDNLAYLLRYDTVYGRYEKSVKHAEDGLVIDGKKYPLFHQKDPAQLPWGKMGVDLVFECTGVFTTKEKLENHLKAGAKAALLSAPSKGGDDMPTVVYGVNTPEPGTKIYSCASCTTNCIAPVVEVMGRRIGVRKAIMTTVHAYTSSQAIVDGPNKKFRRGRAGAANLVPTTTGAGKATSRALPQFKGKFDGVAVRAPIAVGSIADIIFVGERSVSVEEINAIFQEESKSDRYRSVLGVSDDNLVSADIIQDPRASIVDLTMTQVVDGDLIKVMSWYDNEWGYSAQMVREAVRRTKE